MAPSEKDLMCASQIDFSGIMTVGTLSTLMGRTLWLYERNSPGNSLDKAWLT